MKITTIDETKKLIDKYNVLFKVGKITEKDKDYSILGALHDLYEQGAVDGREEIGDTTGTQTGDKEIKSNKESV